MKKKCLINKDIVPFDSSEGESYSLELPFKTKTKEKEEFFLS